MGSGLHCAVVSFVEFKGHARLDRRTKDLTKRVGPDDVAIIDHADLDRVSAEELVESGVRVVVNVARSQTGRYPNPGPLELVRGGVRLIDAPGADPQVHNQRGALALSQGNVYVPFGVREGDCGQYQGRVVASPVNGTGALLTYTVIAEAPCSTSDAIASSSVGAISSR